MGLERVKEEILSSAKKHAESLIIEAKNAAAKIKKDAEKKIEEIKNKSSEETKNAFELMKKQELASAEMELKKMLLDAKMGVINSVFTGAGEIIAALSDKKRSEHIKRLADKANKDIEVKYVYCNRKDIKHLAGKQFEVKETGISAGIIAENKEKTIRVDYSFETMLQSIKESKLEEINKILFVEDGKSDKKGKEPQKN
ncbi:hypothetical protein HYX01_03750 [Candidatus Woesearchaeota archaeon]|nr:hypothetical protein [Candidatus Woesearchaeota archaeon]